MPCHGCRNAGTGGTRRLAEKQRKTDLGLTKETGEKIGSSWTRRLIVGWTVQQNSGVRGAASWQHGRGGRRVLGTAHPVS